MWVSQGLKGENWQDRSSVLRTCTTGRSSSGFHQKRRPLSYSFESRIVFQVKCSHPHENLSWENFIASLVSAGCTNLDIFRVLYSCKEKQKNRILTRRDVHHARNNSNFTI